MCRLSCIVRKAKSYLLVYIMAFISFGVGVYLNGTHAREFKKGYSEEHKNQPFKLK